MAKGTNEGGITPPDIKLLNDFAPDSVTKQVSELDRFLELRSALNALKG